MKASTAITVVLAVFLLVGSANAVTFGAPDGNAHPWVGTLVFQAADGRFYSCTGTLLSSKVMVTAAHCTIDGGQLNLYTWVKFTPQIEWQSGWTADQHIAYLNDAKNGWIKASKVIPHPQYAGNYPNTYDVGLVLLGKPVSGAYGALPPLGFLGNIPTGNVDANLFTVVGYGMQGYIKPLYGDAWERYAGNVRLVELNSFSDGADASAKFSNNPGKTSGGSCYGDSGGPVFYGATNMIAAVVSWGITPCIGVDYQFRLDTPAAQNFIKAYLK